MVRQRGYWTRPTSRTYMYNLDVGEHYYSPMTSYLSTERGSRGETPARSWLNGRRYEADEFRNRYARSSSVARAEAASGTTGGSWHADVVARAARSASEMRTAATSSASAATAASSATAATAATAIKSETATAASASTRQQMISSSMSSTQKTESTQKKVATSQQESVRKSAQELISSRSSQVQKSSMASQKQDLQMLTHSKREIKDDIIKKVADIHMSPLSKGKEIDDANAASARARARILELEKELEEITRKAMTSTSKALKTAKQMAAEATREDEAAMASSFKKTKKVMIESSSKIV